MGSSWLLIGTLTRWFEVIWARDEVYEGPEFRNLKRGEYASIEAWLSYQSLRVA
jgi:hypothetical protein